MIGIGLNRTQMVALWSIAQTALISQDEFFKIINHSGAASLLAKCIENGTLISTKPLKAEMDFELMANMQYFTTSNQIFFTHSHSSIPFVDIEHWRLSVEGDGVRNPFSIDYDELLKLPTSTFTRYLECADNGSILSGNKSADPQWHFGGWGIAEWTGVQFSRLLKNAGIKNQAVEITLEGLDGSFGRYAVPVEKAMQEDTLLAYIMNGAILTPDHGFPLRALVPGWVGAANTKWVNRVIVSTSQVSSRPAKGPHYTTQVMKSACCLPWPALLKTGHHKIIGYAWSPAGRIAKVEVSLDGGVTFQLAALTGPNIERAGTRWEFCLDTQPGTITITPRATDEAGNTQYGISRQKRHEPADLWGSLAPHPVTISADSCELDSEKEYDTPLTGGCC